MLYGPSFREFSDIVVMNHPLRNSDSRTGDGDLLSRLPEASASTESSSLLLPLDEDEEEPSEEEDVRRRFFFFIFLVFFDFCRRITWATYIRYSVQSGTDAIYSKVKTVCQEVLSVQISVLKRVVILSAPCLLYCPS